MKLFFRARPWLAACVLVLTALTHLTNPTSALAQTPVAAPAVSVGQPLPMLALKDQHDRPWHIAADTRLVLFAAGRKAATLVQAVLEKEPKDYLAQRHTVYLADLGKMPSFASRMFALPSLREMPFQVGVSLNEATLAAWPREADGVTLIEVAHGVVQRIANARTEADLRAALNP